jgi:hypothetical protein
LLTLPLLCTGVCVAGPLGLLALHHLCLYNVSRTHTSPCPANCPNLEPSSVSKWMLHRHRPFGEPTKGSMGTDSRGIQVKRETGQRFTPDRSLYRSLCLQPTGTPCLTPSVPNVSRTHTLPCSANCPNSACSSALHRTLCFLPTGTPSFLPAAPQHCENTTSSRPLPQLFSCQLIVCPTQEFVSPAYWDSSPWFVKLGVRLLCEQRKGAASPLHQWIQQLPQQVCLPYAVHSPECWCRQDTL